MFWYWLWGFLMGAAFASLVQFTLGYRAGAKDALAGFLGFKQAVEAVRRNQNPDSDAEFKVAPESEYGDL